ncbi:MAG: ABC transporter ATP-binding protein, partial [Defluviitaleaceae bacterium]|nr:ABC transporter ATP-binding protein [Defluviitaleaceae bacterium]
MRKLFIYLKPYWPLLLLAVSLLLGQAMAELYLPTLMAEIVNEGIEPAIREGVPQTAFILRTGGLMLFIALLAGLASISAAYISPRVAAGAARDMRRDLFTKVENFSQAEFDKFSSASLITRCTNDVAQVQNLANVTARLLLYAPIIGIGGIIMALTRSVSMSWIIALAVIVLIGFVAMIITVAMPKFKLLQEMVDTLNKISREILHGLMVIRAFGTQNHEKKRFDGINVDLRDTGLFIGRVMAVAGPAITFIMGGTQ